MIFDNDTISIARGIIEGCENIVSLTMSHIPNGNLVYLFGGEKSEFSNGIPASLERITITSSLEELDNYALAYAAGLKEVSIPETVIRIGDYAFYGCSELSEINLSEDIEKLGEYSFAHTGIRAFTMPKKVASIPNGLFCGCEELEVFVTNDSLQSVGKEAFEGCLQLKSIELYNATEIGDYAFYGAGLESIVIPKTVTYIGNAILAECNSLKEITVSLDGLSVCDYFSSNSYYDVIPKTLKKIIVNNGESIESYAFEKCEYVEEIVLGEGVVYIDADFSDCIQLRKLVIPSTAEYFRPGSTYYCQKLYEICNQSPYLTFRAGIGDAVNCLYISTSMEDCAPTVETDGYKFAKYGDNWYLISWVEEKTELNLPESFSYRDENAGIEDVSAWGVPSSLFAGCDNITSVTFPKTVNSIGKYAFSDCESVVSVVFDKQAPIAAISNSCFKNCSNLINAVLPDSVIKIDLLAFFGCINLDEIDMPRALEIISTNAFCDCVSLNSITFYENVTRIDSGAFTNCRELYDIYNLSQIVINEGTSDLDEVAKNAFVHTSLSEERSVDVAIQSVGYFKKSGNKWMLVKALENATRIDTTELTYEGVALGSIRILAGAGSDCDYIEELIIGNNVWQIQENAFYGCYYLTNVDMSQNSSIKEIGSGAFKNCKRLNTVSLPSSLEIIGEGAFENCSKLLSITLPETVTLINNSAFRGCVELYEVFDLTETLLVSKDSRNGYVGAYAHKIFTSKDEGGFERFNQNGCYFIVIDDIYYLHHYTGNEVNTVIVPDTGKSIVIMPDAFHGSELSGVVLPRLTLAINSSYSEEYYIADIYYEGTEEDWSGVSCSISANLYFYSTCVHSKYEWTYVDSLPSTDRSELVWSVTKEPTCQSVGMETGVCKIEGCPYSETNEIEMVSHKIVDDQCEYCKAAIVAVNSVNMDVYPSLFNVECNGFVLNESGIAVSQNEDMGTVSTLKITVKQKAEIIFDSTISAGNNDYLYISRNGTILDYMTGINSVETVLKLSAGDYIEITFAKNSNMQIGNNCAYVSGIQITME